jgi:hypothetical protein
MIKRGIVIVCLFVAAVAPACSEKSGASRQPEIVVGTGSPPPEPQRASLRFAVIGDSGRWSKQQQQLADQVIAQRERFPFEFVVMLGDNNYGDGSPESYKVRFEQPFKPLLDAGVKFYAALGNHDVGPQWDYPLFNMNGHRYYTFEEKTGVPVIADTAVRFWVLDSNRLDAEQLAWLDRELSGSKADWKIALSHHPIYSSGRYSWAALARRRSLEPVLVRNGVNVVLSGHEHLYERLVPQNGIMYFTSGGAGSVRVGDLRPSRVTAAGYDRDLSFMLIEIAGDTLYFQAINRVGETIDSGRLTKKRDSKDTRADPQSVAPSIGTPPPTAERHQTQPK